MPFLSEVLGKTAFDSQKQPVGKVVDVVVPGDADYPEVRALEIRPARGGANLVVPWGEVKELGEQVELSAPAGALPEYACEPEDVRLAKQVLDHQVVDIEGRRLRRVNDLQLSRTDGHYRVIGVDISTRGLLRRAGLEKAAAMLGWRPSQHFIPWEQVERLPHQRKGVQLKVSQSDVARLHPSDIGAIVDQLTVKESMALLDTFDPATVADVLQEASPERQASILEQIESDRAADILEEMEPDDAADVLADMSEAKQQELLRLMEDEESAEVIELLEYPEDTAGGVMTPAFATVPEHLTTQQAIDYLRQVEPDVEMIYYVYVVDPDTEQLKGVVSLRELLLSPPDTPLAKVAKRDLITVNVYDKQDDVARAVAKYNLFAIPVIDDAKHMKGIVTVDDAIDILLPTAWKKRLPRMF